MRNRLLLGALVSVSLMIPLTGCTNPSGLDSISVTPSTESLNIGQQVQLTATGTYGNANRESTQPVTSGVTWTSSAPSCGLRDRDDRCSHRGRSWHCNHYRHGARF